MNEAETIAKIKNKYGMKPHPEGGFYAPYYKSSNSVSSALHEGKRAAMTSIHYLLSGSDFSAFHRLSSDEIWHYFEGNSPIIIHIIAPSGEYKKVTIGKNCSHGYQYIIPAKSWFAAELMNTTPDKFALAGCTVSPGFEFKDFELADRKNLQHTHKNHSQLITRLTRNSTNPLTTNEDKQVCFQSKSSTAIKKIVIIMAMHEEAVLVIEKLQMKKIDLDLNSKLNASQFYTSSNNFEIILIINGTDPNYGVERIGTTPAALITYEVINKLSPDLIISAGTAGGYAHKGACVGDVYMGTSIVYHDRRIPLSSEYQSYGNGNYKCPNFANLAKSLNLKTGIISTGNAMSISDLDQKQLSQSGAVAKDMEVASIAEVCQLFNIPIVALKAITNLADRNAKPGELFWKNLSDARENLSNVLPSVLNAIFGKNIKSLEESKQDTQINRSFALSRL